MSRARLLLGGIKSYLPVKWNYQGTGGTDSAEYSLGVWLRHLEQCRRAGIEVHPGTLVEIGPGDSVTTGTSALLSGFDRYVGVDVVPHIRWELALEHLELLTDWFASGQLPPMPARYSRALPPLAEWKRPESLRPGTLPWTSVDLIERIRAALVQQGAVRPLELRCPWSPDLVEEGSADWVMAHGVLQDMGFRDGETVLQDSLATFHRWLRPGGVMTHHIDLTCPAGAPWNHHWAWSPAFRRLVRGRRPYYHNGAPLSLYVSLMEDAGFEVTLGHLHELPGLERTQVSPSYRGLPDLDYRVAAAFLIARKP